MTAPIAPRNDHLPIRPDSELAAALLRLPGPLPLTIAGVGLVTGAVWVGLGASFPLNLLFAPLGGLGLGALALGGVKLWFRRRLPSLAAARAPRATVEEVKTVERTLAGGDHALSVAQISEASRLGPPRVVLALADLDARGVLVEHLDERDGTFRYALDPDADRIRDDDSHVSLRDRVARSR